MISQAALLEFKHGDAGRRWGWRAPRSAASRGSRECGRGARPRRVRPAASPDLLCRAIPATPHTERGRSLFEGVLRNYPKRLDLWSVYLDQEVAAGDQQRIR